MPELGVGAVMESSSNIELLYENLVPEILPDAEVLLQDPIYKNEAVNYLTELFNENGLVLNNEEEGNHNSKLVNEIAELDSKQNLIEENLKKTVIKSSGDIIESRISLNKILDKFDTDFNLRLSGVYADLEKNTELVKQLELDFVQTSDVLAKSIDGVIDILELPSLAGLCVKAGYFHETLEISSFTRRLSIRYPGIDLIGDIEIGVKQEIESMEIGMLKLLKTDLKQSNIVKIIGYLNRIYPFNTLNQRFTKDNLLDNSSTKKTLFEAGFLELQSTLMLKRIYLQSRYQFITEELEVMESLKQHSVEKYLKRVIELIREHCFSSVITFQSIFPRENDILKESETELFLENDQLINEFITNTISQFVEILKGNFGAIDKQQTRDSLILQIIYCSQSLGRIGGEFGSLLLNELHGSLVEIGISEVDWFRMLKKQRTLIKSLNK